MAVTQEFIRQVAEALEALGASAVDNNTDVPFIDAEDLEEEADSFSMPMVKVENQVPSYGKVTMATLVEMTADKAVSENYLLEAIEEEDLYAIFYPSSSSSE